MLNGALVDDAEQVLRDRVAEASQEESTTFRSTLEGFKRFAQTQFEVPDSDEADGCLIEYGVSSRLEFYVHLMRQFEQLDEDGEHGEYIQTSCDIVFSLDDELKALGYQGQWWFRSGNDDFNLWWREQTSSAWVKVLSQRAPKSIEFIQDAVC